MPQCQTTDQERYNLSASGKEITGLVYEEELWRDVHSLCLCLLPVIATFILSTCRPRIRR